MAKPALILADEPTGNLDSRTSADVLALLQGTIRAFSQTLVMITHNPEIAQLAPPDRPHRGRPDRGMRGAPP